MSEHGEHGTAIGLVIGLVIGFVTRPDTGRASPRNPAPPGGRPAAGARG